MKSAEQIAREHAEKVSCFTHDYHQVDRWPGFDEGVRVIVLAAIEEYARQPIAGGMGEEREAQIRERLASPSVPTLWAKSEADSAVRDLLAEIDHLRAILRDCAADGLLERRNELIECGRREGFRQGSQAQRRLCAQYANAVHDAPLAEPPEEGEGDEAQGQV